VCVELEEEKSKHARDMEQGDNVTYMLEKDRERLKQEVGSSYIVTNYCALHTVQCKFVVHYLLPTSLPHSYNRR